jgi:hypothetical protein
MSQRDNCHATCQIFQAIDAGASYVSTKDNSVGTSLSRNQTDNWVQGEKIKRRKKKLPDKNSLNVAIRVSLFISSYDNMYERHFSLVVLISIPFRHSINNCHKVGLSYIVNPQPHHPFRFNMTQARSHSQ